ncbi:MerR family transcriptional regulator [Nocardia sp. NPDC051929]|uniref:MerR family transcriptional regulator n=1 Tax=Nocardia sp. NPDC051929 TaxID=3364327 RepID=UPI0037C954A9
MITIGQLARYAGVTIKAVRVYHERGLLPEPPRDSSGYRRYSAEDAIDLVKIKTLARSGVPLARIKELLTGIPTSSRRRSPRSTACSPNAPRRYAAPASRSPNWAQAIVCSCPPMSPNTSRACANSG